MVTVRTDGSIAGEIDRCKLFSTTISSDPNFGINWGSSRKVGGETFLLSKPWDVQNVQDSQES